MCPSYLHPFLESHKQKRHGLNCARAEKAEMYRKIWHLNENMGIRP